MGSKGERINLRIDAHTKELLEAASEVEQTSVSAFVLSAASVAAENVLADRRTFTLNEENWEAFDNALERPARDVPGLRELMNGPNVLGQAE